MAALSEHGFLRQPHTSAGRIPTEEGFRYFVSYLMGHTELPTPVKQTITHQFYQARNYTDEWMRLAASVLASQSQAAALVTSPRPIQTIFKHLELISLRGRQVLMILVLGGGEVRQQMLTLAEPVKQERLSMAAEHITQLCLGLDGMEIANLPSPTDTLEQDTLKLVTDSMRQTANFLSGEVYRDGITNMLAEPEFSAPDSARRALRVLEERPLLENLLTQTMNNTEVGVVQVLIGGEGTWEELSECSMVLARYGVSDMATGMLGVLGPIRMRYGPTISTVRFVAGLLSERILETHTE